MAEQVASAVASAVIGGITDRAFTTVMRKLRFRPAAAHEKLQRLETAVLKLRCAVEVSEKHAIESASLLEWRDRLREAAAEGGAVVLDFQRRAREDGGEAASTSTGAGVGTGVPSQQQPAGALYFTRSALALGGMAQRVRDATRRLFSADEDMEKLDSALEKMERLSPDITQFLLTLQLEVSSKSKLGQVRSTKRRRPWLSLPVEQRAALVTSPNHDDVSPEVGEPRRKHRFTMKVAQSSAAEQVVRYKRTRIPVEQRAALVTSNHDDVSPQVGEPRREHRSTKKVAQSSAALQLVGSKAEAALDTKREARMLARVLERTLQRMDSNIKATDDRDMGGLEWLSEWASVLRETMESGNAVLRTLCPGSDVIHKAGGGALEADGELYSFARAVEWLAPEEPCFAVLVDLCPRKQ